MDNRPSIMRLNYEGMLVYKIEDIKIISYEDEYYAVDGEEIVYESSELDDAIKNAKQYNQQAEESIQPVKMQVNLNDLNENLQKYLLGETDRLEETEEENNINKIEDNKREFDLLIANCDIYKVVAKMVNSEKLEDGELEKVEKIINSIQSGKVLLPVIAGNDKTLEELQNEIIAKEVFNALNDDAKKIFIETIETQKLETNKDNFMVESTENELVDIDKVLGDEQSISESEPTNNSIEADERGSVFDDPDCFIL